MQKHWLMDSSLTLQGEWTIFEKKERKEDSICSYAALQSSAFPSLADIPSVAFIIYFSN